MILVCVRVLGLEVLVFWHEVVALVVLVVLFGGSLLLLTPLLYEELSFRRLSLLKPSLFSTSLRVLRYTLLLLFCDILGLLSFLFVFNQFFSLILSLLLIAVIHPLILGLLRNIWSIILPIRLMHFVYKPNMLQIILVTHEVLLYFALALSVR